MDKELEFVKKEIKQDISRKLEEVSEKMNDPSFDTSYCNIEVLSMVNDELGDVLLNFEPRVIQSSLEDFDNEG